MKHIQFGAGNIGRSFIGQLFARAGYEVVFVEIDTTLVELLNRHRRYPVKVRDRVCETIWVEGVRAIHADETEHIGEELANADCAATAVGPSALPHLFQAIALGLEKRYTRSRIPLDIILCENLRGAAEFVRTGLKAFLPDNFPLVEMVGLVETSIGKMVPIMTAEQRRADPLAVYAEAYNTLICDKLAFRGPVPKVSGIDPKDNMPAYVDRKLFIHNLGHAVTAYVGYVSDPSMVYVWQAVEREDIRRVAEGAMTESAQALMREYPGEFTQESLKDHIDDLLCRFANRALGDTIYRVGRDLPRKLSPEDRLIGALRLDLKHGIHAENTIVGVAAAMLFGGRDEAGRMFPADEQLVATARARGPQAVLREVGGVNADDPVFRETVNAIAATYERLGRKMGAAPA